METMLMHVEAGYAKHGNPYHNHMHACDVLQTVHYFISETGLAVSYDRQAGRQAQTRTRDSTSFL
jgi:hypothetical protein